MAAAAGARAQDVKTIKSFLGEIKDPASRSALENIIIKSLIFSPRTNIIRVLSGAPDSGRLDDLYGLLLIFLFRAIGQRKVVSLVSHPIS